MRAQLIYHRENLNLMWKIVILWRKLKNNFIKDKEKDNKFKIKNKEEDNYQQIPQFYFPSGKSLDQNISDEIMV